MDTYKEALYQRALRLLEEAYKNGSTVDLEVCFEKSPFLYSESENLFLRKESTGEGGEEMEKMVEIP